MYKLLNRSDFSTNDELEKSWEKYSKKYGIDYFELIKYSDIDNSSLKKKIKGYHLRFFPTWLDLYFYSKEELLLRLGEEKNIRSLCGGITKDEMLEYYKKELERVKELEVEYVVLHACNIDIFEGMTYNFRFSDMEILEKVVEFVNEIFDNEKYNFTLLLENLWWPGLKLTSYLEADYLIKNIKYKNTGFMLDTGHMLNTNLELKNSDEGVDYILENLENLKEYKNYIYGVHLNLSLSGEYVKRSIELNKERRLNLKEVLNEIYFHVEKIDYHFPFDNMRIKEVLKELPLKYLVYEFIARDEISVERAIEKQEKILY
ncbi:TIM barrel protein [uncultured Fusobacterium sp.]|uniref:sugar phosphate isomerase/epimerase family protein n=1 Tax=uncultured Fusobacterium sp. TaxID=159267 RepID=UPI0025FDE5D6|nr:TIM barrel protein [uncultured Fusobacterium sp.]